MHYSYLLLVLLFLSGCTEPEIGSTPPEPYDSWTQWFTIPIRDTRMEVYASRETPVAAYTELALWFPERFPGDPSLDHMTVLLHRSKSTETNVYITGGVCVNDAVYDVNKQVYTTSIAPDTQATWTLECGWEENGVTWRGAATFLIETMPEYPRVLEHSTGGMRNAYVWIQPDSLKRGQQAIEVEIWRPNSLGLTYDLVSERELLVTTYIDPDEITGEPDTLRELNDQPGRYTSMVTISSFGSWTVSLHEETIPAQQGVLFIFDVNNSPAEASDQPRQ
ncbi:hypothetical protein GF324_11010 [bacterium]|nr:hypothetical protein [bacterium]